MSHLLHTFLMMNMSKMTWIEFIHLGLAMYLIAILQPHFRSTAPMVYDYFKSLFCNKGCSRKVVFRREKNSNGGSRLLGPMPLARQLFWFLHSRKKFDLAEKIKSFDCGMSVMIVNPDNGLPLEYFFNDIRFPTTRTLIDDDIYIIYSEEYKAPMKESQSQSQKEEKEPIQELCIKLSCKTHRDSHLQAFLDKIETIYYNETQTSVMKISDLVNIQSKTNNRLTVEDINENYLYSSKSFDNLFFEQKNDVLKLLDNFESRDQEYKRLGIPNNLSFMFHGPPGTGKTSCIKAIANYLKRDIVMVRLVSFTTDESFINALTSSCISKHERKKMYVFEEIDSYTDDIKNPFLARSDIQTADPSSDSFSSSMKDIALLGAISQQKQHDLSIGELLSRCSIKEEKLSLAGILSALDGVREANGRVCIFTTNRLHRIDPAILRPGRTDLIVYFGPLLKSDINLYFHLWFHRDIPENVYQKMKDKVYTQAQIGKLFLKYKETHERLYDLFVRSAIE